MMQTAPSTIHILLVEDDPDDYVLVRDFLADVAGDSFRIEWAQTVADGLLALRRTDYDVVLLDYRLGEETGLDLLGRMPLDLQAPPVILLTGQGERARDLEAMRAGAVDYLAKSEITPVLLERSVRYAVAQARASVELEVSEKRFRSLIENASDLICVLDPGGASRYISPAIERILGYSPDEARSIDPFALIHSDDRESILQGFRYRAERPGVGTHMCFRIRHRDGTWRAMEAIATNLLDDPAVEGIVVNARDVTDRLHAMEALRASEQRALRTAERMRAVANAATEVLGTRSREELNAVLSSTCAGVLPYDAFTFATYDPEGHVLHFLGGWDGDVWDPDTTVPLAGTPSELVVRERRSLLTMHSDDPAGAGATLFGTGRRSESVIRTPILSGERVLGVVSVQSYTPDCYTPEHVEVLEAFAAVAASALQNIELLAQLGRSAEALWESEERFRLATRASHGVIWDHDILSGQSYWGESLSTVFGYAADQVGMTTDWWAERIHPEDRDEVLAGVRTALEGDAESWRGEYRFLRADGSYAFIIDHALITRRNDGRAVRVIGSMRDITARRQMENALRERERQLAEAQRIAQVGSWEWDILQDTITWSDEHYRIFGLEPQSVEMSFERFESFLHPDDREPHLIRLGSSLRDGSPFEFEQRIMRPDGEVRYVQSRGVVMVNENGVPVRMVGTVHDFTERKAAENALRESEQKFRRFFEHDVSADYLADTDGTILECNPAFAHVFGFATVEDAVGSSIFDLSPDRATQLAALDVVDREGRVEGIEAVMRRVDGRELRVIKNLVAHRDEHGSLRAVQGYLIDVTDQRRAEEAQRESEERYRLLTEMSDDGIIAVGQDGRILYANPAVEAVLGYSADEMVGMDLAQIVPERLRAAHRAGFERYVSTGIRTIPWRQIEIPGVRRDATEIVLEVSFADAQDRGRPFLIGTLRDITNRKRAEQEVRRTEERYRLLLQAMAQTHWRADGQGGALPEASTWCEFTGQSPEEFRGSGWLNAVHPGDRAAVVAAWSRALEQKSPFHDEHRVRRFDGKYRRMMARAVPIFEPDGSIREWIGAHMDVTERRDMEEELRQSQKMDAIGRLAGGVAHDFNNLLTVIRANSELILMDLPEESPVREDLQEIKKASDRAANLTRQLLAFSRKQVLQPRVLDLSTTVSGMTGLLRRIIGEDVELVTSLDPRPGRVLADPGQIEQVVMNLAVNARDAMSTGGRMEIDTRNVNLTPAETAHYPYHVEPGRYVRITVRDTGCGMDEETLSRAFDPFFTTKEQGKGTGLGLSTVYGIVKQSGGYVWLDSEVQKGTSVAVYLPSAEAESDAPVEPPPNTPVPGGTETILVVEDQEQVLKITARLLERAGYRVLRATSGVEALSRLEEHPDGIDLVLTDVVMPGMSGPQLAERIAEFHPGRAPRVVFMSGYTDHAIVQYGVFKARHAYIEKPFKTPEMLLRTVRDVLNSATPV